MSSPIKQLALVRRRSGQTAREFFGYHYQKHASISTGPTPEETPLIYYQTHFFDTAYNNAGNAQPAWTGHNGSTELWFKDGAHLNQVFSSDHVRNTVGPDGVNFNDFIATIAMFSQEQILTGNPTEQEPSIQEIVATYYIQAHGNTNTDTTPATITEDLNPKIIETFGPISTKIVANIALPDPEGKLKYFQSAEAPIYSAAYQIYLSGVDQIPALRAAQKKLEAEEEEEEEKSGGKLFKTETAFVTFGVRSVVLDQRRNVTFHGGRQPRMPQL